MSHSDRPADARDYYRHAAARYHEHYASAGRAASAYPSNQLRLEWLLDRLDELAPRRVLDIGCGEGTPLTRMAALGAEVYGCDYTAEMVAAAKQTLAANGLDPAHLVLADLRHRATLQPLIDQGPFDAVVCFGVMPHLDDNRAALENLRACLAPGGRAFIEFRNKLFSLFTMNRLSHALIVDDLLAGVPESIRNAVAKDLEARLEMDRPAPREPESEDGVGFDAVLAKFDNPLEMDRLFAATGFAGIDLHWYHYHPAPPYLEGTAIEVDRYRAAALALEGETSGWRGYFLCSAYVVEAET
jgi:2-polyprenyl-3-methyl-5-hydroxy-6-metoxy-1,4-benzoquinol methylase